MKWCSTTMSAVDFERRLEGGMDGCGMDGCGNLGDGVVGCFNSSL